MKFRILLPNGLIVIIAIIIFVSGNVRAQDGGLPLIRNFTPAEYKAGSQNWGICQDDRGIMYIANDDGVIEYDGVSWKLITIRHYAAGRWIVNYRGTIYVAAQGDCGYLTPDSLGETSFRSILDDSTREALRLTDVWECDTNSAGVFFRTREQLIRWNGDSLKIWNVPAGASRFDVLSSVGDTLYIRIANFGIYKVIGDDLIFVEGSDVLAHYKLNAVVPYKGQILFATRYEGFFLYNGRHFRRYPVTFDRHIRESAVYHAIALKDGRVAFATLHGGILIMDTSGRLERVIDRTTGLMEEGVNFVFEDRGHQLWTGMRNGISRIENIKAMRIYDLRSGLTGYPRSVTRHRGSVYAGTTSGLFMMTPGDETRPVSFRQVTREHFLIEALCSHLGDLFIGANTGVYLVDQGVPRMLHKGNTNTLYGLSADTSFLFAGQHNGIAVFQKSGKWRFLGMAEGLTDFIHSIAETPDSSLWATTSHRGILRLRFGRGFGVRPDIERFGGKHGLPPGQPEIIKNSGRIFFSVRNQVFDFDENAREFKPLPGWADSLERVPEDNRRNVGKNIFLLGRFAGTPQYPAMLRSLQMLGRVVPNQRIVFYIDADSGWWFGGNDRLFHIDPEFNPESKPDARLLIRRISVNRNGLYFGNGPVTGFTSDYGEPLQIDYAVPCYQSVSRPRYQIRLDGIDREWTDRGEMTSVEYLSLPPGDYTLMIRASDEGHSSIAETRLTFTVKPPWYRTVVAWIAYAFALTGLVALFIRWRIRILKNRNILLQQLVEQRTSELREAESQLIQSGKMAALGQMVAGLAHEINNPLNFILPNLEYVRSELNKIFPDADYSGAVESDRQNETGKADFGELTDALRASVEGSLRIKDIVVRLKAFSAHGAHKYDVMDIESHLDVALDLFIKQYTDIRIERQFSGVPPVRVVIQEINQCFINILMNAVQAIHDAYRQKILPPDAGRIDLITRINGSFVDIIFTDNGTGIPEDVLPKIFEPFFTTRPVGHGRGLGLTESYAVIQKHGGDICVESQYGKGTTVMIKLPLEKVSF